MKRKTDWRDRAGRVLVVMMYGGLVAGMILSGAALGWYEWWDQPILRSDLARLAWVVAMIGFAGMILVNLTYAWKPPPE